MCVSCMMYEAARVIRDGWDLRRARNRIQCFLRPPFCCPGGVPACVPRSSPGVPTMAHLVSRLVSRRCPNQDPAGCPACIPIRPGVVSAEAPLSRFVSR